MRRVDNDCIGFPMAAVTNFHNFGALNNTYLLPDSCGGCRSELDFTWG